MGGLAASPAEFYIPPPPRRAVFRALAVTAAALAATVLTHAALPDLHADWVVAAEPACLASQHPAPVQPCMLAMAP